MSFFPRCLSILASLALPLGFGASGAIAQTVTGAATIFEDVRLGPTSAATTVRGISGGAMSATQMMGRSQTATGPCLGFIDEPPDHRMELTDDFNFLSLQVQSTADTTLVVRGPGGIWCNDNYSLDFNPGIAGGWLPGTYEIWVGSHRVNRYYPYVIQITTTNPDF